jgi:hypothetical protein
MMPARFFRIAGVVAPLCALLSATTALTQKNQATPPKPTAPPSARPPPPRPPPLPITKKGPAPYLKGSVEKKAYALCKDRLFTGLDLLRRGLIPKLAVTDEDAIAILNALDALPSRAYNNVLHALAATSNNDPYQPTLLDKLIVRGTSQFGNATLSDRFLQQLQVKLTPLGNTAGNKVLQHISPDSVERLKYWGGWKQLARSLGW